MVKKPVNPPTVKTAQKFFDSVVLHSKAIARAMTLPEGHVGSVEHFVQNYPQYTECKPVWDLCSSLLKLLAVREDEGLEKRIERKWESIREKAEAEQLSRCPDVLQIRKTRIPANELARIKESVVSFAKCEQACLCLVLPLLDAHYLHASHRLSLRLHGRWFPLSFR